MKKIEIMIIQKPVYVNWECYECCCENKIDYNDFLDGVEICDWMYEEIECKECGAKFKIDNIEWD